MYIGAALAFLEDWLQAVCSKVRLDTVPHQRMKAEEVYNSL